MWAALTARIGVEMKNKGFLMVTMTPPPEMEEEFNDWYDTEHVPERIALEGFETARRYVCVNGFPRYMAAYDLASPEVLDGGYQQISGDRFSPWTKRILRKTRGLWRVTGEQLYPGDACAVGAPRLLLLHYGDVGASQAGELVEALRATYEGLESVLQIRVVRYDDAARTGCVALIEGLRDLISIDGPALQGRWRQHIVLCNEYADYWAYAPNVALGKVMQA